MKKQYLFMLLIIFGSVAIDQSTKIAAQQHLMTWQDSEDLRVYGGQRVALWSWGDENSATSSFLSFNLNYVRNQGAAWGMLSSMPDSFRIPFFYLVTLIAVVIILSYLRATPPQFRFPRFALTLILSGAIGNFLDRVQHGYVIDFLDVRWQIPLPFTLNLSSLGGSSAVSAWSYNFPNFNWADSCITVGVALLLYDILFLERHRNAHTT